ncbi:hypothetical protein MHW47_19935 [Streptomyces sp. OfavH-34-F]|uniref:hypothetical protein n=1 Tax=unclassified Streptomyces TaxID=2593676 RepID=UPI001EF39446|nr:hypothetical protein [Streptomyces sp. OfavH-34-F]MCG7526712.1 hypothetical protein [Streptomyces sp. OfavH-34-F]
MNRVETVAARLLPEVDGGALRPLEMERPACPTLATPAVGWAVIEGAVFGYGLADMVFGGDARTATSADASVTGSACTAAELIDARLGSISA